MKARFLRSQLSVNRFTATIPVLLLLSSALLLYSYFATVLSVKNDYTALAIPNKLLINNTLGSNKSDNNVTNLTSSVKPVNHTPVANAGQNQIVSENTTVALVGASIDSDPYDTLSYLWRQTDGPAVELSNRTSANPTFTSPVVQSDTDLMFSLIVTDDKSAASKPATVTVTLKHINQKPVANAGTNQTVKGGYAVTLDGSASKDPNGDPFSYSWVQVNGPSVKLQDNNTAMATFTAPSNVTTDTDLNFKLTIKDNKNATDSGYVKVTVKYEAPPNKAPIANAGQDQTINAGNTVTLDGNASKDPDGDITSYLWMQTEGKAILLNDSTITRPSFKAPGVLAGTTLKFSLTVKDNKGATSLPDTVAITVYPIMTAPTPLLPATDYSLKHEWGSKGIGDGHFNGLSGVAIDSSGSVYVADGNDRIQKFDSNGNFITKWGSQGHGDGQFTGPSGVAIDSSGSVYVADTYNHRIQKFDSNGNFITKWGSREIEGEIPKPGQFSVPNGVAIDSSGSVYVVDTGFSRIQKFDSNGNFITEWGSKGIGDGQFDWPTDVAIDSSDNVYVADGDNPNLNTITVHNRIQKFDSNGNFITKWGSKGIGDGQFNGPRGVALDSSGSVYVADTYNHRIQKFDSNGNFITKWRSKDMGSPIGIAVDSSGNVYVSDTWHSNQHIQVFAPQIKMSK